MSELKASDLEHIAYLQTVEIQSLKSLIAEFEAEIDQLAARWRQERQDDKWIPVSERLPKHTEECLVAFMTVPAYASWSKATYYQHHKGFGGVDNYWDIEGLHYGAVTHWMPKPQLPEVQE